MSEINNDECVHLLCDGKRCGLVIRNKELNKELCKYKKTPLWKMKIYLCEGPNGCKYYCPKEEYLRINKNKMLE